jgi:predicted RNA-binding Zn ribbon-like protein
VNEAGFYFLADELSLDFCNTLMGESHPEGPFELLPSVAALHAWYVTGHLITSESKLKPDLASGLALRSALRAVYWSIHHETRTPTAALKTLNSFLEHRRERVQLRLEDDRFALECVLEAPNDPVYALAQSAALFLAGLERLRLKKCSNPDCDLLFYDRSRNNSRQWCSMQTCGNRAKQARFRNRVP